MLNKQIRKTFKKKKSANKKLLTFAVVYLKIIVLQTNCVGLFLTYKEKKKRHFAE